MLLKKLLKPSIPMTGNNYLLDTNIVIEIFDGNKKYADKIYKLNNFYLHSIVVGELYTGVNRVKNKANHLKKLLQLLDLCTVLNVDKETSKYYGETIAMLYKKGKPKPTNDVWIAAIAMHNNLTLVTNDNHCKEIESIKLEMW
jgi:tRNA(fMet)-specific endonuclease VapC